MACMECPCCGWGGNESKCPDCGSHCVWDEEPYDDSFNEEEEEDEE